MLPLNLNLEKLSVLLIGTGEKLTAREVKLRDLGAKNLTVIASDKFPAGKFDVVMIVGFDDETSSRLHKLAKTSGALVNVEDQKEYCDFFFQSFVKRGDLLISISTHGKSPGTAKIIRDKIEETFPEIWSSRIDEIAQKRAEWKKSGLSYDEVNQKTQEYIKNNNWL